MLSCVYGLYIGIDLIIPVVLDIVSNHDLLLKRASGTFHHGQANHIMTKIFGIPILLAVICGASFPYYAISLFPIAFIFLFLIIVWAGLTIEWKGLVAIVKKPGDIFIGIACLFILFPGLQWIIARTIISDKQLLYGLVFTSLTPVAVVAPFFTKTVGGDEELSFLILVCSMVICPFVSPVLLKIFVGSTIPIDTWLLFKNMLFLITVPLLISYLIYRFLPKLKQLITPALPMLNMSCLSLLIYTLWGALVGRVNLSYTSVTDIALILLLVFLQDFGVLALSKSVFHKIYNLRTANALVVSLSMKNVAVAAGILLFYDPGASVPAALAFIAHAFLFNFIILAKKFF